MGKGIRHQHTGPWNVRFYWTGSVYRTFQWSFWFFNFEIESLDNENSDSNDIYILEINGFTSLFPTQFKHYRVLK